MEENGNALKHAFNGALLQQITNSIIRYFPSFNTQLFLKIEAKLETLEMKPRVQLIRDTLAKALPKDYPQALKILVDVLNENQLKGFPVWPIAEFIQTYGLNDREISLKALKIVTTHFTSEWAIRPFIKKYPKETMQFLLTCTEDNNEDIRRWASEGTRPRVPWGEQLQEFIKNPEATKDILEALKFDPELFVRKSIANHLNDITKDHPGYVIQLLNDWKQQVRADSKIQKENQIKIDWIIRHALRTLIKNGHPDALALIGVHHNAAVKIEHFSLKQENIKLGENLEFEVKIQSTSNQPQKIVLDYVLHFMKSNDKTSPKIFKLRTFDLAAYATITIKKSHNVKKITTRQYYAGVQKIEIQVNGKVLANNEWNLTLARA